MKIFNFICYKALEGIYIITYSYLVDIYCTSSLYLCQFWEMQEILITYSCKQKHELLFRKSEMLNYKVSVTNMPHPVLERPILLQNNLDPPPNSPQQIKHQALGQGIRADLIISNLDMSNWHSCRIKLLQILLLCFIKPWTLYCAMLWLHLIRSTFPFIQLCPFFWERN